MNSKEQAAEFGDGLSAEDIELENPPEFIWKRSKYRSGQIASAKLAVPPERLFKRIGAFLKIYWTDIEVDEEDSIQYTYKWNDFETKEEGQENEYYDYKFVITGYRTRGRPEVPAQIIEVIIVLPLVHFYYNFSQEKMVHRLYSYLIEKGAIVPGEESPIPAIVDATGNGYISGNDLDTANAALDRAIPLLEPDVPGFTEEV